MNYELFTPFNQPSWNPLKDDRSIVLILVALTVMSVGMRKTLANWFSQGKRSESTGTKNELILPFSGRPKWSCCAVPRALRSIDIHWDPGIPLTQIIANEADSLLQQLHHFYGQLVLTLRREPDLPPTLLLRRFSGPCSFAYAQRAATLKNTRPFLELQWLVLQNRSF